MNINLAHRRDSIRHKSGWVRNLPDRTFLCLFKSLSVLEDVLFCRCCCCTEAVHARATPTHRGAAEILAGYSFSRFPRDEKPTLNICPVFKLCEKGKSLQQVPCYFIMFNTTLAPLGRPHTVGLAVWWGCTARAIHLFSSAWGGYEWTLPGLRDIWSQSSGDGEGSKTLSWSRWDRRIKIC